MPEEHRTLDIIHSQGILILYLVCDKICDFSQILFVGLSIRKIPSSGNFLFLQSDELWESIYIYRYMFIQEITYFKQVVRHPS